MHRVIALCLLTPFLLVADTKQTDREGQRDALSSLQSYVGQWRGVGQLRRGSREGAWTESAEIAWRLTKDSASLELNSPKGKYFQGMAFKPGEKTGDFVMEAKLPKGAASYDVKLDDQGALTMEIRKPVEGAPDRLQARLIAGGKRLVILYQRRLGETRFGRIAEVGFTRKGSGFGTGTNFVECIVTGGEGTIPVRFEGKTYFVCCSGCKEYFDDDPAKAVAEYHARKAKEKSEKAKQDG